MPSRIPRHTVEKSAMEMPHADTHEDAIAEDVSHPSTLTPRGDEPVVSAPGTPRLHTRGRTPPPPTPPPRPKIHQTTPPALKRLPLKSQPPLLKAMRENSVEAVCSVLQNSAGVASEPFWDYRAELPLRAAIRMKCSAQIVQLLLEHGASAEAVCDNGLTALDMLHLSNPSCPQFGGLVCPPGGQGMAPPNVSEPSPFLTRTAPQLFPNLVGPSPFEQALLVLEGSGARFHEVRDVLESRAAKETN